MSTLISKTLSRTIAFLQGQLETKREQYNNMCERLARAFEQEGGPDFETSSDEGNWRDLQATIEIFDEAIEILLAIEKEKEPEMAFRLFFSQTRHEIEREEEAFKLNCQDLAAAFRREGGPDLRSSEPEADWRCNRATIRARKTILDKLFEIEEIVGNQA